MLVTVFLRTEMPFGLHGLAALRTDRPPTFDHFLSPASHGTGLSAGTPKPDGSSLFRFVPIHYDFSRNDNNKIAVFIIAQSNFPGAKDRFYRGANAHLLVKKIRRSFAQIGVLGGKLGQELLDTDRQRLKLNFFNDDCHGPRSLKSLNIKNALAGRTNRISGDMVTGIYIDFKARHKGS